jgi:adenosylcobinamide-phosphate synthase
MISTFLASLLVDGIFGDPPNRFHPTAWMGNLITFLLRFRPRISSGSSTDHRIRFAELAYGLLILIIGLALVIISG